MSDAADDDFGDFNDADAIVGEKRDEKDETHSESAEVETPDEKVEGQTEPLNTEDEVQTHEEHLEGFDWNAVSSPEHQLRAEEWNETTLSSASAASTEPGSDVDENVSENHATETQLNASDSQTEPLDNVEEAKDTETAEEPSPEPSPVAQFNDFNNPEPEEGFDEDDDFGDFGEVEEETAEVVAAEAEPAREPEPAAQETVADPLSSFYNLLREVPQPDFTTPETITSSFGALLSHLFPAAEPEFTSDDIAPKPLLQPATDASGRFYLAPNPDLATAFPDFARLADIPTYDEETGLPLFRWRRSEVRKAWLKALQVPVNLDDMFPPAKPLKAASSPIEQRPDHLAALLDPKEADLKRMTTHQLRELAASLARELKEEKTACVGLLERKQKLMDESDRHNKMIATLVQIAQTKAAKGKK